MADRYFPNPMPDYGAQHHHPKAHRKDSLAVLLQEPPPTMAEKFLSAALHLKDEIVHATWEHPKAKIKDYTMYTGLLGTAFLSFRAYQVTGNKGDLQVCRDIIHKCTTAAMSMRQCPTFLCGQSGIYALGAAAAKSANDEQGLNEHLELFNQVANQRTLVADIKESVLPYELLYGRAGFLWAALFLNNQLGTEVVSRSLLVSIADAIISAGRAESSNFSSHLMYQWHGKHYWGAAHGLAGIMHCLLHLPLRVEDMAAVKGTLNYMIENRFADSGNYPSSEENTQDRLVQWCHGAPGVALTLCRAAEVFPEERDFQRAALEAGDVVWHRGLVRKLGICHGISGNTYTFLALYRTNGDEHQLYRARAFACFILDRARKLIKRDEMHGGDRPYSLFEGLAGTACLLLDMVDPQGARFPGYEL